MSPILFRINRDEQPLVPVVLAAYRKVPIDPTSNASHLACEDGTIIAVI